LRDASATIEELTTENASNSTNQSWNPRETAVLLKQLSFPL
jgi:hypothetical protein